MTRTVLLVAVLVASTALFVSTGAFPLSDGTDQLDDVDVVMEPADGPNGQYAVINENDEIELLLSEENPDLDGSGIAEDTVTPIHRVFTITNNGTETARVWISDDADDVRFYRDDNPGNSLEGPENEFELGPSETVSVGLLIDTRGDHDVENASQFTVHVEQGTPTPTPTVTPEPTTTETSGPTPVETPGQTPADTPEPEPTETPEPTMTDTPTPTPTPTETPEPTPTETPEDGTTVIDRVFTIANNGTEPALVWLSDDAEDVRFYRGDDPNASLEGLDNASELDPNETVDVGLVVDTSGEPDVESISGFTVHVAQGASTPALHETPESTPEGSTTATDRVFTIANDGTEPTRIWLSDDAEDVSFFRGDDRNASLEGLGNASELDPNETVDVGVLADAEGTPDVDSIAGFTVHVAEGTSTPVLPETPGSTPAGTAEPTTTEPSDTDGIDGAGGIPTEIGGFDLGIVLPVFLLLSMLLLVLAWYRRRVGV